ncbi:hypothetical protein H7E67_09030 [Clostridium gasigenes]|uniref:Carboxypeptidase regulatory-like domain-containing protein n=1 Tax=Clostridium gasigenes TaxID=94869 RepID=A0A7X0SHJ0_9CLOT|nr:hypothetical protein [Clostridium gasigenes]MBB6623570.1 hypothetical protein [Clostridium gasigenes]MBB6715646.1 hypothetical protein [Clostridium gasigenes]
MCAVIRKMISGIELYNNEVKELNFNFASQINEGRTLLKGRVVNIFGKPIPKAAVEITVFDEAYIPYRDVCTGVTFTLLDGSYGISLPYKISYGYRITAYC